MIGDSFVAIAAAVLCVLAVSAAGASLESSVAGDPGDGIALAYDGLPMSQDHADAVVEGVAAVAEEAGVVVERITVTTGAEGVVNELDAVTEELALDDDARPSVDRSRSAAGDFRDDEFESEVSVEEDDREDPNAGAESWVDRLVGLFRGLQSLLVVFGLFAFALAYRRADDLRGLVRGALPKDESADDADGPGEEWPAAEPPNEVSRAWAEMIRRLDIESPRSKTATECATAAVEAGMDPEAVRTITRAFEAVRYGDGRVTDERVRRVRRALRNLDSERGGGPK